MLATLVLSTALATTGQVSPEAQAAYRDLLSTYVKRGRVDYKGLEAKDLKKLDMYLDEVAKAKLPSKRNARILFWVDAYNASVLRAVIREGRPRSVLDKKGFFDNKAFTVAHKEVSLNELEKKVLNPFAKDPRTHMVLVCAAVGCPIIENEPYFGSNLEKRFDRATRRYLSGPTGAVVKPGQLRLSKIFDWYKGDFGGPDGVLRFAKKYLSEKDAKSLGDKPWVGFIDYNWTLNQQ